MLDFMVSQTELGKPVGADLKLGLATAPVLYAWEQFPELGPLIERKFSKEQDVERVKLSHFDDCEGRRDFGEGEIL